MCMCVLRATVSGFMALLVMWFLTNIIHSFIQLQSSELENWAQKNPKNRNSTCFFGYGRRMYSPDAGRPAAASASARKQLGASRLVQSCAARKPQRSFGERAERCSPIYTTSGSGWYTRRGRVGCWGCSQQAPCQLSSTSSSSLHRTASDRYAAAAAGNDANHGNARRRRDDDATCVCSDLRRLRQGAQLHRH